MDINNRFFSPGGLPPARDINSNNSFGVLDRINSSGNRVPARSGKLIRARANYERLKGMGTTVKSAQMLAYSRLKKLEKEYEDDQKRGRNKSN